jgi:hypothetical protein
MARWAWQVAGQGGRVEGDSGSCGMGAANVMSCLLSLGLATLTLSSLPGHEMFSKRWRAKAEMVFSTGIWRARDGEREACWKRYFEALDLTSN